ncbi:MAG: aminotransferase class I/II-fold pyridoxal phosphate-dependent enzyme [Bacteroidetes bacterium]|nr:aminotransferase class I/II-fold pyridoxal phosphate-dependent enzyme [Bacteroidota bacterium]MBS1539060.1 aminotransferase class I/II-fold pyridoxal phosphate-dependent enzyme [Bacteroidota bacterium]
MICDLRSDTVTKPTPAMLDAMLHAPVGDDVFGEDPTVNQLEKKCADMLGMDGAVFCPSGTMTNQIGIKVLTQPYEEVICYKGSHIFRYEGGGLAGNSHVGARLLNGDRGRISVAEISANINNAADSHQSITSVVALENTVVREAGSFYTLAEIKEVSTLCRSRNLKTHLDGARLFNALAETNDPAADYGKYFDTISICLSKGLGAPVGSVLAYKKEYEKKARRVRKAFGGGMRQAGFLAAAGIYALDHHIARLKEDHQRARALGNSLQKLSWVKSVMPVDTNIVIIEVAAGLTPEKVLAKLSEHHIRALPFSATEIRFVTHLDFSDDMLDKCVSVFNKLAF